ncbi:MAG: hypothetical protein AAGA70_07505 [Pseudomonadota bacterium]
MTSVDLADFRAQLPQCELAVYADIGSGTVLLTDGSLRYPQEYLDALCECAAQLFRGDPAFDGQATDPIMVFGPTGGRVFFRAPSDPTEALCCICGPETDVTMLITAARRMLAVT